MHALAEAQVAEPAGGHGEPVRIGKAALVAVRGAVDQHHPAAGRDGDAVQGDLAGGGAANQLQRGGETDRLLDGVGDQGRFSRSSARWPGFSASSLNSVPVSPAVLSTPPRNSTIIRPRTSLPNSPVIAEIVSVVPTITVGWRDIDLPRVDAVANDDLLGASLATRHLIELGHRRIAHVSGRVSGTGNVVGKLRQRGYEDTMRAGGLGEYIRVEPGDFTEDVGYRATVRLLNSAQPPTAIFAVDDMTCLGAQSAASEMNIGVPGRLSLVGYDNS